MTQNRSDNTATTSVSTTTSATLVIVTSGMGMAIPESFLNENRRLDSPLIFCELNCEAKHDHLLLFSREIIIDTEYNPLGWRICTAINNGFHIVQH